MNQLKKTFKTILPMVLFPIITLYLFEWYTHNPFTTMKIRIQLLNIVLFELIMALLLFLFGRFRLLSAWLPVHAPGM